MEFLLKIRHARQPARLWDNWWARARRVLSVYFLATAMFGILADGVAQSLEKALPAGPSDSSEAQWNVVVDAGVDQTKYNHDSSVIRHGEEWILAWNGNVGPTEGTAGQKNYFVRGSNWDQLRGLPHVAEFQSPDWSVNPVSTDEMEWHPSLLEFGGRLECWWFATPSGTFSRSIGYRSVWDDKVRKWTNYKIQLLPHGKIGFSSNVGAEEPQDRVTINKTSYVPMPLATAIRGRSGLLAMPMIISPSPSGGTLGGPNEVVIFSSNDEGSSWRWSSVVPKEPGNQRSSIWEPWMTWDGEAYRLYCRNFGEVPPGKGYSHATAKNLDKWSPLADAALDMMPMRGTSVTDGQNWYVALCERAQIGTNFNSSKRRALSLFRSRNGEDWQLASPLLPIAQNAYYCWLYMANDGNLYFSSTLAQAIVVGRLPIADKKYRLTPERAALVSTNKNPFSDGRGIFLAASEYLRIPVSFERGRGFSMAAFVRTGSSQHGLAVDFAHPHPERWGKGFLPLVFGGWRTFLHGWSIEADSKNLTVRTGEVSFVGLSFDEAERKLRVVRRNQSDAWESREWHVRTIYFEQKPVDGTLTIINGLTYRWTTKPTQQRDVALAESSEKCLTQLAGAVKHYDPHFSRYFLSDMFSTEAQGVRNHIMFLFDEAPTTMAVDGKYLRSGGNTFDTPEDHITLNANNRAENPWVSKVFEAGIELWKFGLWNSALSIDDFKSLYATTALSHGSVATIGSPGKDWSSANVLLDPGKPDLFPPGLDYPGHIALATDESAMIYGDGGVAVEVPGKGDWEWEAEFRFNEFPVNLSWDLLAIGNKFSLGKLEVAREATGYFLKRGEKTLCSLSPNEWTKLKIRYHAGTADLLLPSPSILRVSVRPLLHLGRWFSDRIEPMEVNRPASYRTEWRNIHVLPATPAR